MSNWLAHSRRIEAVWDRFSGGEDTNLLLNYFEVFNEGIIGREAEMRSSFFFFLVGWEVHPCLL